ncbi:hypothetical protein C8F01DRAFT_1156228 [Mycena amicta]|nr:hypothetical protein C8F01DRAFT_1156228 [Mycena amicta]
MSRRSSSSSPALSSNALAFTCRHMVAILHSSLVPRPTAIAKPVFWSTHPDTIPKLLSAAHQSKRRLHRAALARHGRSRHTAASSISIPLDAASADVAANWEEEERQPLHITVERRSFDMVQPLLSHGPPADLFSGPDGYTACMHASEVRPHPASSSTTLRISRKKGISGIGNTLGSGSIFAS